MVLIFMLGAGALEGSILEYIQLRGLQEKIPRFKVLEWVGWIVLVAVLGWLLGMLPSLFFPESNAYNSPPASSAALANPLV